MPDSIRKVEYFKIMIPNKRGEAAKILKVLRGSRVNLLSFSGFPRDRGAQLDFIPEDTKVFAEVAKKAYARINVTALDGVSAGQNRYGAILWVKPPDVAKTAKVLRST